MVCTLGDVGCDGWVVTEDTICGFLAMGPGGGFAVGYEYGGWPFWAGWMPAP